jgi:serine/threonine protein phosphatase 1
MKGSPVSTNRTCPSVSVERCGGEGTIQSGEIMEKIYAIGDIHGCFDQLRALMDKIPIQMGRDKLVFMGDYIDRGPESYAVVEYLIELRDRFPAVVFLKGNHEEMLENYLEGADRFTYLLNGGQQTLDDYLRRVGPVQKRAIPENHLAFFKSLVLFHQTENYIFVHAGLRQNLPLEKQRMEDMLWIREQFVTSRHDFGKKVIFGHTPFPEPLVESNKIGIDTGAVYGNRLTCVQLPEETFFSV